MTNILIAPRNCHLYSTERMTARSEVAVKLFRQANRLGEALRGQVVEILAQATINANDSIEEPASQTWEQIFLGTVASWTCERDTSNAARAWFARRNLAG